MVVEFSDGDRETVQTSSCAGRWGTRSIPKPRLVCCFLSPDRCRPLLPTRDSNVNLGFPPAPLLFPIVAGRTTTQLLLDQLELCANEVTRYEVRACDQGLQRITVIPGLGRSRRPPVVIYEKRGEVWVRGNNLLNCPGSRVWYRMGVSWDI